MEKIEEKTILEHKEGDVVKIIRQGTHGFNIGDNVTIKELFTDGDSPHYLAESADDYWWIKDADCKKNKK